MESRLFFFARDGQRIGDFPKQDIPAKIASGEIRPTDLTWASGMADWQPVARIFPPIDNDVPPPLPTTSGTKPEAPLSSPAVVVGISAANPVPLPKTYLVWAILGTMFCCIPFGIVSIIYASKVESLWISGRHAEALAASKSARTWVIVTAVLGVVLNLIVVFAYGIVAVSIKS
ncbi:MAG: CD225/dispanin family protein [Puniceicoccales bacterium]|nr:CD225/dispanin family protein [Puniceicoccales bacterium]